MATINVKDTGYYNFNPFSTGDYETVQPGFPEQLNQIAAQLARGYGNPPDMSAYLSRMNQIYKPYHIPDFVEPNIAKAQGAAQQAAPAAPAGPSLDHPGGLDFNAWAYTTGANRQDPASMSAYQDYLRSKGLLGQTGTTQPAYMPPNQ